MKQGVGNVIADSALIGDDVVIGNYNLIGENVELGSFKGVKSPWINIGDCNKIYDNTRILAGDEGLSIGDWNVFHNSMLVMAEKRMEVGHNCWFGQNTILDSTGGLTIGNGVRVGMYSQIWTHVASGELIEGCTLFAERPTVIEDEVWLVGSCIVGSGLRLGRRSICMIGSLLTKDTECGRVYGGVPAVLLKKLDFWRPIAPKEKMEMMSKWALRFASGSERDIFVSFSENKELFEVLDRTNNERLVFGFSIAGELDKSTTYFDLIDKVYTKRLTRLEREFYQYIYNHKARFLPRR